MRPASKGCPSIRVRPKHHAKTSFQDELRALLRRHKVEFDERYVWD